MKSLFYESGLNAEGRDARRNLVIISDCTDIAAVELYRAIQIALEKFNVTNCNIAPFIGVKNFSIENASFALRLMIDVYPKNTVFVVVVNATAYSPDRIVCLTSSGHWLVGNNSGYFNWSLGDKGLEHIYLNKSDRQIEGRSFGGKYVQAPTAASLIAGRPLEDFTSPFPISNLSNYKIKDGTVVHCDNFGLMKIKAPPLGYLNEGDKLIINVNGEERCEAKYSENMKSCSSGSWVLFPGSSLYGLPELAKVRSANSAMELGAAEGDVITWRII